MTENIDIADILAELILDQIEESDEANHKKNDKSRQLLRLLKILFSLDDVNDSDLKHFKVPKPSSTKPSEPKTTTKYVPVSLPYQPGPPYLQSNYLPPNSLITRPPRFQPQLPQSLFQTDFSNSIEKPSRFTETSLPPIEKINNENQSKNKNFINNMIKELMSNVDDNSNKYSKQQYYPDQPYKYNTTNKPKKFKRRRRPPVFDAKPTKPNPKPKPEEIDVVIRKPAKIDNSPFSRYPVKIPTNQISQNPNFQLPIDSLANIGNRRPEPERLSGRNSFVDDDIKFLSFDEQLRKMLKELGKVLK